ncbi:MAG: glycerol-3-phosphate 1-O-acyltransferase PlsY [Lachnospiraceae bacterium]|nr:glycerol-3-phosphate 1-O-acyltransferase PlsY [Lachnospiraceae bacterium]
MARIICLVLGYALGLVQTGYIVGKVKGIDIRNYGSKNAGTTNVLRTMGKKYGVMVLLGDALKCIVAVLLVKLLFQKSYPDIIILLTLYASAGVILGHNFPFYMKFKGGKGIAATLGMALSYLFLIDDGWIVPVAGFGLFLIIFFTTNYVSLGSVVGYISLYISIIVMGELGKYNFPPESNRVLLTEYYIIMGALTVMAIYRHKDNIKRLISGTERKTYLRSKPEIDVSKQERTSDK